MTASEEADAMEPQTSRFFQAVGLRAMLGLAHVESARQPSQAPSAKRRVARRRISVIAFATLAILAGTCWQHGFYRSRTCDSAARAMAFHEEYEDPLLWPAYQRWVVLGDDIALLCAAWLYAVSELQWWCSCFFISCVRFHSFAVWFLIALYGFMARWEWCNFPYDPTIRLWMAHAWMTIFFLQYCVYTRHMELVRLHLSALEEAFDHSLGTHRIRWSSTVSYVLAFVVAVIGYNANDLEADHHGTVFIIFAGLMLLMFGVVIVVFALTMRGLVLALFLAESVCAASELDTMRKHEAQEKKDLRRAITSAKVAVYFNGTSAAAMIISVFSQWLSGMQQEFYLRVMCLHLSNCLAMIISSAGMICIAGLIPQKLYWSTLTKSWHGTPKLAANQEASTDGEDADDDWNAKVRELAARGFTLRDLLRFYRRLNDKDVMPHFDPESHRTVDVVRQAIIPLSKRKQAGYAMATVLDKRGKIPEVMVTHSWSNLFSHTVAAICAEALKSPEYMSVLQRLESSELSALESELYWKNKLDVTYWFCAFSVNQHTCICHRCSEADRDPTSGELPSVCNCWTTKYSSSSEPCSADGQSVPCEMNKFEDMMSVLARARGDVKQVLAVDREFQLFTRAWCVAELHRARALKLQQRMVLCSRATLDACRELLQDLRVENMQASNPADKVHILSRIADKTAFNDDIKSLIFSQGGLLDSWSNGFCLATILGKFAKRGFEILHTSVASSDDTNEASDLSDFGSSSSEADSETPFDLQSGR
eukprot:TRINITY_DN15782_c0_g1_i2.p1 TRINITY_DN15782_c0_g1~~TRINITY_DN15782_c0_g1_i2.p1  ORF type:complete len:765 (-),score=112.16 TRINITY_DN15782_c0_g1_i2:121-2415(-)